jgi:hypothetical protein
VLRGIFEVADVWRLVAKVIEGTELTYRDVRISTSETTLEGNTIAERFWVDRYVYSSNLSSGFPDPRPGHHVATSMEAI